MIRVAIAGGTGYTAGELIRILLNHPDVEIAAVLSSSVAGQPVSCVHRDLLGDTDLVFSSDLSSSCGNKEIDVLFLALGHGQSENYLAKLDISPECRVIDMGNDFRIDTAYNGDEFIYGLCEINKEQIRKARYIANPGCFATSIILPLFPLAYAGELSGEIHIHAVTGSTGAGKSLSESTHFSYRNSNMSVYKPFTHQHLGEIKKTLSAVSAEELPQINFVPMRGDFTRGIFASIYTKKNSGKSLEQLTAGFRKFYEDSPFVFISDSPISLKEVVNTNKSLIHIDEHNGYWHFTSIIDNLLKGASGQAVQNMNLMFGLEEKCGLSLKGTSF